MRLIAPASSTCAVSISARLEPEALVCDVPVPHEPNRLTLPPPLVVVVLAAVVVVVLAAVVVVVLDVVVVVVVPPDAALTTRPIIV